MSQSLSAKDVFADALELETVERAAFVHKACAGNPALLADVLGLIATHDNARNFLNLPTIAGQEQLAEAPGTIVGNYKLRELIGEGGFGSVFLAEQERPVRRKVAFKIIKLGMDTRAVVARFEQERQALAMMDHPNIAKVLDAGATDTGRPYFVMDLVRGESITGYCDKNNLTIDERLELFTQVCQAVQHAHTKGVIHRDIKPSNILVATQDGRALARVIDFGIAKATAHRLTEKTVFTEFRHMIGTPEYMSPEQAEGGLDIDTRTDVYSLGVLLYELLTGTTPFDGKKLRSAAFGELQRIIREVEPPKPSTRIQQSTDTITSVAAHRRVEPSRLGTQVRGELDWIVMKALDKDRARRYESAGELGAEIKRHLAGEAVTAAPPTRMYRVRKLVSRHRGVVLAGSLVMLALLAGAVGMSILAIMESRARVRAERAEVAMKQRSEDLERVADFQSSQLKDIQPVRIAELLRSELLAQTRTSMEHAKLPPAQIEEQMGDLRALLARPNLTNIAVRLLDGTIFERSVQAVNQQFEKQPLLKARLLQTLADTMTHLGLTERAAAPQAEALAIRRKELGDENADTVESMGAAADLFRLQGRLDLAAPLFEEAYATSRRVLGNEHLVTLAAINNLGALRQAQGKTEEAEKLQREGVELSRKLRGESHPDVAGAMSNLAFTLGERNQIDEAVKLMQDALAIRKREQGEDHPDTLEAVNNLGFMLVDASRAPEAERLFREALEGRRRILGDDHPSTITMINNIGSALRAQGKAVDAESHFRQSLEARRRVLGSDHPDTLLAVGNLGVAIAGLNRFDDAYPFYREVYEGRMRLLGPEDPDTLTSMSNMGALLDSMDKPSEAEAFSRGAYEGRLRVLGPDHADTLVAEHNYGYVLQRLGRLDEAEKLYVEVLAKRRKALGPTHARTLIAVHSLGTLKHARGLYSEAEVLLKDAVDGRLARLGEKHPLLAESRYWYARTLFDEGKVAEAEAPALAAARQLETQPAVSAAKLKRCAQLLADIYLKRNETDPGNGFEEKAADWKKRAAP